MIRALYTLCFYLAVPFILLRLWWKGKKNSAYRVRIKERFGFVPFTCQRSIWLHAVSLGEATAAIPLVEALLKTYPQYTLVITNTTPTGSDKVRQHFGNRVQHCYFPYDLPSVWQRFFACIRPQGIVIMETELWPNLLSFAQRKKVPVVLVNARLSDASIKKYHYLRFFIKNMLNKIKLIAAQSELDAERFKGLGAEAHRVINVGNLKFDVNIAEDLVVKARVVREQIVQRPIWVAASTHKGEDEQLLKIQHAILKEQPEALLIIVPRHPERFEATADLIASLGLRYQRKSQGGSLLKDTQVWLGDTMGELQFYYALADVAFVGGTLVPVGGHNPLEALVLGKKVITGPYTQNAKIMYAELKAAGLVDILADGEQVKQALLLAFKERLDRNKITMHMQKFQGVKDRVMALIATHFALKANY